VVNHGREIVSHHYTHQILRDALQSVGLKKGDIVFSHSNVGFLGIPVGGNNAENVFNTILNAFFDVIGEEGTLVVPTFTYSFSQGKLFDPDQTPSDCGIFTEMLRKHSSTYRSEDPCVSVASIGARAAEMTQNIAENTYGKDSFFDRFYKANGKICNINFDAGSTFVHYVERALKVPYRFDKTFTGTFQKNGKQELRKSVLWVRHLSEGTTSKFETFSQLTQEKGLYKTAKVGRGFIGLITAKDVYRVIEETLPLRPWFLTEAEMLNVIPELII